MATGWVGTALLRERLLVYAGAISSTDLHAHHAIQIAVALEQDLQLRDATGQAQTGKAAVIACDVRHAIEASGRALLVFVDPDDVRGGRLRQLPLDDSVRSWFSVGDCLHHLASPEVCDDFTTLSAIPDQALQELAGPLPQPDTPHPALSRLLAELPHRLDQDVRLPALAKLAGVSQGRLTHVFKDVVGIPLRQYILWLRLQKVVDLLQAGASLTAAAHAAGFSESSHLSNTFRRMFGLAPSEVAGSVRWVGEKPQRS